MGLYKIDKTITLMDRKSIIVDIDIPFNGELEENRDYSLIEEIMTEGLYRGTKNAVESYCSSELPNKFILNQKIIVTNNLPESIIGTRENDDIYLEADAIQGIRYVSANFLLAQEVGHKISKYIDKSKALQDIGDILGITSDNFQFFLLEIFANACGNIALNDECYDVFGDRLTFDELTPTAIKQKTLYNIYLG